MTKYLQETNSWNCEFIQKQYNRNSHLWPAWTFPLVLWLALSLTSNKFRINVAWLNQVQNTSSKTRVQVPFMVTCNTFRIRLAWVTRMKVANSFHFITVIKMEEGRPTSEYIPLLARCSSHQINHPVDLISSASSQNYHSFVAGDNCRVKRWPWFVWFLLKFLGLFNNSQGIVKRSKCPSCLLSALKQKELDSDGLLYSGELEGNEEEPLDLAISLTRNDACVVCRGEWYDAQGRFRPYTETDIGKFGSMCVSLLSIWRYLEEMVPVGRMSSLIMIDDNQPRTKCNSSSTSVSVFLNSASDNSLMYDMSHFHL